MQLIRTNQQTSISSAVVYRGIVLETVLTGIPRDEARPIAGGAKAEMREIFRQLDEVLRESGLGSTDVCSARIYLQHVNDDVEEVNEAWREYFRHHAPNRRCYGVNLQLGMRVEAAFVAEFPE